MSDIFIALIQQSINGLVLGCIYVLVALGLTMIYGILTQINFAHADFVTLGAFAAYFFVKLMGPSEETYLLSIGVALIAGALLGVLIDATVFAPLREHGDELRPLIATIGVSILLENGALAVFGPIPYQFNTPFSNATIRIGRIFFTEQSLLIVLVAIASIAIIYAFMKFTFTGKALRAVSQDRETAGLMGINQNFLIMITIVIASALAGMSGAMLAPMLVLTPYSGTSVILKAFAIIVIGGFGNMEGTIIVGILIGLMEAFTTQYLGAGMIDMVVFAFLLIMLLIRPTGLIAERREENV